MWYIVLTKYTTKCSYGMLSTMIRKFAYNYELAIPIRYNQICLTSELKQIRGNSMPWRAQYRRWGDLFSWLLILVLLADLTPLKIMVAISLLIPGQNTHMCARKVVLVLPKWDMCNLASDTGLWDSGIMIRQAFQDESINNTKLISEWKVFSYWFLTFISSGRPSICNVSFQQLTYWIFT